MKLQLPHWIGQKGQKQASTGSRFSERSEPLQVLGVGPRGRVYLATDKETGRHVVFRGFRRPKQADGRRWKDAVRRFTDELVAARALDHPNIARVYEFGPEE